MKELEYPFGPKKLVKQKIKLKKALLADTTKNFIEKKIAVLGGE